MAATTTPRTVSRVELAEAPAEVDLGDPGTSDGVGRDPLLAVPQARAEAWPGARRPGGLDALAAKVDVAGMGEPAAGDACARGVLGGDEPTDAPHVVAPGKAAPVTDLCLEHEGSDAVHAPVGRQAGDGRSERLGLEEANEVGLDGAELGLPALDGRLVASKGGPGGRLVKRACPEPLAILERPRRPVSPDLSMAPPWRRRKCPSRFFARVRSSVASPLARHRSRTASSALVGTRIATSSPERSWRTRRRASRLSVFTRSPGARGMSEGAITWQEIFIEASSRCSS